MSKLLPTIPKSVLQEEGKTTKMRTTNASRWSETTHQGSHLPQQGWWGQRATNEGEKWKAKLSRIFKVKREWRGFKLKAESSQSKERGYDFNVLYSYGKFSEK